MTQRAPKQQRRVAKKAKRSGLVRLLSSQSFNSFQKPTPIASNEELLSKLGSVIQNEKDDSKAKLKKSKRATERTSQGAERAARRRVAAERDPMRSSESLENSTESDAAFLSGPVVPGQAGEPEDPPADLTLESSLPNDNSGTSVGPAVVTTPADGPEAVPSDLVEWDCESCSNAADDAESSTDPFSKCQICGEDYSSSLTSCPFCAKNDEAPKPADSDHASAKAGAPPADTPDAGAGPDVKPRHPSRWHHLYVPRKWNIIWRWTQRQEMQFSYVLVAPQLRMQVR